MMLSNSEALKVTEFALYHCVSVANVKDHEKQNVLHGTRVCRSLIFMLLVSDLPYKASTSCHGAIGMFGVLCHNSDELNDVRNLRLEKLQLRSRIVGIAVTFQALDDSSISFQAPFPEFV